MRKSDRVQQILCIAYGVRVICRVFHKIKGNIKIMKSRICSVIFLISEIIYESLIIRFSLQY